MTPETFIWAPEFAAAAVVGAEVETDSEVEVVGTEEVTITEEVATVVLT